MLINKSMEKIIYPFRTWRYTIVAKNPRDPDKTSMEYRVFHWKLLWSFIICSSPKRGIFKIFTPHDERMGYSNMNHFITDVKASRISEALLTRVNDQFDYSLMRAKRHLIREQSHNIKDHTGMELKDFMLPNLTTGDVLEFKDFADNSGGFYIR